MSVKHFNILKLSETVSKRSTQEVYCSARFQVKNNDRPPARSKWLMGNLPDLINTIRVFYFTLPATLYYNLAVF